MTGILPVTPYWAAVVPPAFKIDSCALVEPIIRLLVAAHSLGGMTRSYKQKAPENRGLGVAERTGLEPATSGVTGRHSNQLNYRSSGGNYLLRSGYSL